MSTSVAPQQNRYQNARISGRDYLRYLVALLVSYVGFTVLVALITPMDVTQSISWWLLFSFLRIFASLATASALGHLLLSWLRGRVSLTMSSLVTAAIFFGIEALWFTVATTTVLYGRTPTFPLGEIVIISAATVIPVIVIAHLLRLLVLPLRPRLDGKPVRYFGKNETVGTSETNMANIAS